MVSEWIRNLVMNPREPIEKATSGGMGPLNRDAACSTIFQNYQVDTNQVTSSMSKRFPGVSIIYYKTYDAL